MILFPPRTFRKSCPILAAQRASKKIATVNKRNPALFIRPLRRSELPADTVALARFLIGKVVVHDLPAGRISGRIVETEAYPPGDPAGHHFRGPTPRIRSMYLARGHAYIFFNYGAHFMLNVVSERAGTAAASATSRSINSRNEMVKPISQPRLPSSRLNERNGRRGVSGGIAAAASCSFV